ncbi:MAG: DRTGG domain-containing protein [Smithella sp.]
MRPEVLISEVASKVGGKFLHQGNKRFVKWVVASSLMSDILTTEEEDILLLSNLNTVQVVRTADMIGANAIMIAGGKPVTQDMLDLARKLDISLISTNYPIFETCFQLAPLFNQEKK